MTEGSKEEVLRGDVVQVSRAVGDPDHGEPELGATPRDELAYRLRQQELIAEFGLAALRGGTRQSLLETAVASAAEGMNVRLCKFLEPEGGRLVLRAGIGWKPGTVGHASLGLDLESPAGFAYQNRCPVLSNHLESETRFRTPALLKDHGVRRALNVPVRDGDSPYGVLEVDSTHPGRFTSADIAFMQGIANTLSVALERLSVEQRFSDVAEREHLLAGEMRHRVKNLFAVTGAIVAATAREIGTPDAAQMGQLVTGRLRALSLASEVGLDTDADAVGLVDVLDLSHRVLAPYGTRVDVRGEAPTLPRGSTAPLALVLHELATNAVKYGALSNDEGQVELIWREGAGGPEAIWTETGGPAIEGPAPEGFGQGMTERMLAGIGGRIAREWHGEGLKAVISL